MTLEEFKNKLSLKSYPACWTLFFDEVCKSFRERSKEILSREYILSQLEMSGALEEYKEEIVESAALVRKNELLSLFVCMTERWLIYGAENHSREYDVPEGKGKEYSFLTLLAMIPTFSKSINYLKSRNVPQSIIDATMKEYDICVDICKLETGSPYFGRRHFNWMHLLVENELLRIGRLNFALLKSFPGKIRVYSKNNSEYVMLADNMDVHKSGRLLMSCGCEDACGSYHADIKETEDEISGFPIEYGYVKPDAVTLNKNEWTLRLKSGDPVIGIHIPRYGSFDSESIESSYRFAKKVFAECYPDYKYKAFSCISWLMDTELQKLLKPGSNILSFQKKFLQYPHTAYGTGVFSFVFLQNRPEDLNTLPEDTSLMRAIKKHYLSGKYIQENGGVFFDENVAE